VRLWRVLGVAGLAGVAATGAIIARDRRRRAQVTPEEVRRRLRDRLEAGPGGSEPGGPGGSSQPGPDASPPAQEG
jgi:hypothetical protein